jgi:hypothetical protein
VKWLETQWRPSCPYLRVKQTDIVRKRQTVRWSEMIGDKWRPSCPYLRVKQTEKIVRKDGVNWLETMEILLCVSERKAERKMEWNDWRHWRIFYVYLRERRRERWSEMIGDTVESSCACLRVKQTEKGSLKDGAKWLETLEILLCVSERKAERKMEWNDWRHSGVILRVSESKKQRKLVWKMEWNDWRHSGDPPVRVWEWNKQI